MGSSRHRSVTAALREPTADQARARRHSPSVWVVIEPTKVMCESSATGSSDGFNVEVFRDNSRPWNSRVTGASLIELPVGIEP